ncbi:MAG: isocitrate lyase, partial [Myxococcota bacterium]|nr:isocitrate lyase [Myxococcota bacterium]
MWKEDAEQLEKRWQRDERWSGIRRAYPASDVIRLRGSVRVEYTLAHLGADRLWSLMLNE